jgi:hypothetical protein
MMRSLDIPGMSERGCKCPGCGREAVAVQGRLLAGRVFREWLCAKCSNSWPVERPIGDTRFVLSATAAS